MVDYTRDLVVVWSRLEPGKQVKINLIFILYSNYIITLLLLCYNFISSLAEVIKILLEKQKVISEYLLLLFGNIHVSG